MHAYLRIMLIKRVFSAGFVLGIVSMVCLWIGYKVLQNVVQFVAGVGFALLVYSFLEFAILVLARARAKVFYVAIASFVCGLALFIVLGTYPRIDLGSPCVYLCNSSGYLLTNLSIEVERISQYIESTGLLTLSLLFLVIFSISQSLGKALAEEAI